MADRPASIRHLKNFDDNFIARCLHLNSKVYNFIDKKLLTLTVLQDLINRMCNEKNKRYGHTYPLEHFSQYIRDSLPEKYVRKLCVVHPQAVTLFSKVSYDLYKAYALDRNTYLDYKDIPEEHRTEELLAGMLSEKPRLDIPEEVFTDSLVDKILSMNSSCCINFVPVNFITHDRLVQAFTKQPKMELTRNVPVDAWCKNQVPDLDLIKLAATNGCNLEYIPEEFITREMCLEVVKEIGTRIKLVPKKLRSKEIVLEAMCSCSLSNIKECIPVNILTRPFLIELAKRDAVSNESKTLTRDWCFGIKNYQLVKTIDTDEWVDVIKVCPSAIILIEKLLQSDAIMKTFFENASISVINKVINFLNLAKIKKEYIPYCIGSDVKVLQDIMERKMSYTPKKRNAKPVAPALELISGTDVVGVDLTDAEYRDIIHKFGA